MIITFVLTYIAGGLFLVVAGEILEPLQAVFGMLFVSATTTAVVLLCYRFTSIFGSDFRGAVLVGGLPLLVFIGVPLNWMDGAPMDTIGFLPGTLMLVIAPIMFIFMMNGKRATKQSISLTELDVRKTRIGRDTGHSMTIFDRYARNIPYIQANIVSVYAGLSLCSAIAIYNFEKLGDHLIFIWIGMAISAVLFAGVEVISGQKWNKSFALLLPPLALIYQSDLVFSGYHDSAVIYGLTVFAVLAGIINLIMLLKTVAERWHLRNNS